MLISRVTRFKFGWPITNRSPSATPPRRSAAAGIAMALTSASNKSTHSDRNSRTPQYEPTVRANAVLASDHKRLKLRDDSR